MKLKINRILNNISKDLVEQVLLRIIESGVFISNEIRRFIGKLPK